MVAPIKRRNFRWTQICFCFERKISCYTPSAWRRFFDYTDVELCFCCLFYFSVFCRDDSEFVHKVKQIIRNCIIKMYILLFLRTWCVLASFLSKGYFPEFFFFFSKWVRVTFQQISWTSENTRWVIWVLPTVKLFSYNTISNILLLLLLLFIWTNGS